MDERIPDTLRGVKSDVMDQLEEAVDDYLKSYWLKSGNHGVPTISEIENLVTELRSKTRNICLEMVSDSLTNTDESEMIASKKENTSGRE